MEEDFVKNVLATARKESGAKSSDTVERDYIEKEGISRELDREPVLKQNPSPGDHRRVIVIHRLRFPRFLTRRRLGMPFRKV